jgi:hypothetical protein
MSNNTGAVADVTIRSSDPNKVGAIGLDMRQRQNGPNLVQRVTVDGFDVGVHTLATFSLVFEHVTVRNQNVVGFYNERGVITVRGLRSENKVTAFKSGERGTPMLSDCAFVVGGDDVPALIAGNRIYLRDLRQQGYAHAIRKMDGSFIDGAEVREWFYPEKGFSLHGAKVEGLRLPVKEAPHVPWESDLGRWQKVAHEAEDDSEALQAAVDRAAEEGRTTVYLSKEDGAKYQFGKPVRVHGSVNRIVGMNHVIGFLKPLAISGQAFLTLEDLTHDAFVIERFWFVGWNSKKIGVKHDEWDFSLVDNRSGKPLILRYMTVGPGRMKTKVPGSITFMESVVGGGIQIGRDEEVYARQWNPEGTGGPYADVSDGGILWVMGIKSEGLATHIAARNGARAELLGGRSYQSWKYTKWLKNHPGQSIPNPPMFVVKDADASFTIQLYSFNKPYNTIVEETLNGATKTLPRADLGGNFMPLYRAGGR